MSLHKTAFSRLAQTPEAMIPPPSPGGWRRLGLAILYSWKGLCATWRHEAAFRQEILLFSVLLPIAFMVDVASLTRILVVLMMALVISAELFNSGIEAVVDKACPERHELAARAKDCGSAAVFVLLLACLLGWSYLIGLPLLRSLGIV